MARRSPRRGPHPERADALEAPPVGRATVIEVPQSGRRRVALWRETRGLPADEGAIERFLPAARRASGVLTDEEVVSIAQVPCDAADR